MKCPTCNNEKEVIQDWMGIIAWNLLIISNVLWWVFTYG